MSRTSQLEQDVVRNDYNMRSEVSGKRLDLNDLIKRNKEEEKKNKKNNLLIFSGVLSLVVVILIFLSIK